MGIKNHGGSGLDGVEDNQCEEENDDRWDLATKFSSGVRFRAVLEDAERQLEGKQNDDGYVRIISNAGQLQGIIDDADGLGDPTVPDLHVLKRWETEQPRPDRAVLEIEKQLTEVFRNQVQRTLPWLDDLLPSNQGLDEKHQNGQPADGFEDGLACVLPSRPDELDDEYNFENYVCSPTVLFEEQEARHYLDELHQWRSTLKPMHRVVHLVEKHFGYQCPWWDSPNALVRVWGQLDCALQVFSDERMIRDLVEVLGKNVVTADLQSCKVGLYGFSYLTENAARLKKMIAEKYGDHLSLLDAIIRKQDNDK